MRKKRREGLKTKQIEKQQYNGQEDQDGKERKKAANTSAEEREEKEREKNKNFGKKSKQAIIKKSKEDEQRKKSVREIRGLIIFILFPKPNGPNSHTGASPNGPQPTPHLSEPNLPNLLLFASLGHLLGLLLEPFPLLLFLFGLLPTPTAERKGRRRPLGG